MSKYSKEINQELFERIDRYLSGDMDAGTRQVFETEMSVDPELLDEVNLHRRLMAAVEMAGFVNDTEKSPGINIKRPFSKRPRTWLYAAAIIAVIAISYMGWHLLKANDDEKADLYATYFFPDPGLPVAMGIDSATYLFNEGMVSYKEENYSKALETWNALPSSAVGSDTLHYFMAMAQLNAGDLTHAAKKLDTLVAMGHTVFHKRAVWYLALIRVKEKDYQAAVPLLEQLHDSDDARQLLQAVQQKQSRKP